MNDNEIRKALECCSQENMCEECPYGTACLDERYVGIMSRDALDLINRQKAEKEALIAGQETLQKHIAEQNAEIERLRKENDVLKTNNHSMCLTMPKMTKAERAEAIKEFAEKIDQLFYRYAHILSHADCARKDYIKADDGTEIEMQSVWDVFTLKEYGIAEYDEMNRLQTNIELIEKGRLLAELKKDFRLLVKEMVGETNAE